MYGLENQSLWQRLNPTPAGELENQGMLGGGGQFDPPSQSHV